MEIWPTATPSVHLLLHEVTPACSARLTAKEPREGEKKRKRKKERERDKQRNGIVASRLGEGGAEADLDALKRATWIIGLDSWTLDVFAGLTGRFLASMLKNSPYLRDWRARATQRRKASVIACVIVFL